MARLLFAIALIALVAASQPVGDELTAWQPPAGEERMQPKAACSSLRALTGFEFSVIAAETVPASGDTAAYCRVEGLIVPEIRFEVSMPMAWHGRLLVNGNGGYAGENLQAPGRQRMRDAIVTAGFIQAHTNTGHDAASEPLGAFGMNPQKLVDYSFRAIHLTTVTAKTLSSAFYGQAPKRSYFMGCSTGGRQALIAAQRFPGDFDGIVAGAPVLDFVGTMVDYVARIQSMGSAPVSADILRRAGDVIYARCDALDGVRDGLIEDPRRCDFHPSQHLPKCSGSSGPDCFSAAEIAFLTSLYGEVRVGDERVFPGWPIGIEVPGADGRTGWYNWLVRDNAPPIAEVFAEAFFRYLALPVKDPNVRASQVDLAAVVPQLRPIRQMLNATDTDLTAFRDRGGKLLMWFGWADPALNPNMGVEYYQAVQRTMGPQVGDFFRLFMMPGVFHCAGGPGCDTAPRLAALIRWVEEGLAPETIVATKRLPDDRIRSRPLCPFPQVARYKGSGSTDEAANFACVAGE